MEDGRAPYSGVFSALPLAFIFVALVVKPSPYRKILFFPTCAVIIYVVFFTTSGDVTTDNGIACGILPYLFIASDYIFLTDVQNELRLQGQTKPISDAPFRSRLPWAFDLLINSRGIGWTHEKTSVLPPRPKTTRVSFVVSRLAWAGIYFLVSDLAGIYNRWNPCYAKDGPSLTYYGWPWQAFNFLGYPASAMSAMGMLHCLLSAAVVATGIADPQYWPHLFGKLSEAYTVRNFWGRTWHQLLRRVALSHGQYLANKVLRLRQGTIASSLVQLFTGFFVTGLIHYGADYMMLTHWGGGALKFFMLQAVAITFESGVIGLATKMGVQDSNTWKLVGYLWVWFWFACSTPIWFDVMFRKGVMDNGMQFSVILGLWRGEWFPTF